MLERLNNLDWNILLWWVLATAAGTTIGMIMLVIGIQELGVPIGDTETESVAENAAAGDGTDGESASGEAIESESPASGSESGITDEETAAENPFFFLLGLPLFAGAGAILGAAQWLVVRRIFQGVNWWFAVTAAGWGLSYLAAVTILPPLLQSMPVFLAALAPWLIIGAFSGLGQWTLLRKHIKTGGAWWVIVSAVAMVVGINVWLGGAGGSIIEATCGGLMGWAGGGALSGIVLLLLADAQLPVE